MTNGEKPVGWSHLHPEHSSEFPVAATPTPTPAGAAAPPPGNQAAAPPVGSAAPAPAAAAPAAAAPAAAAPAAAPNPYPQPPGPGVAMNQQQPPQSTPPRAQAQHPAGSVAAPGDEVLFAGRARHTASLMAYLKWTLVGILGGVGAWGLAHVEFFSTWPLWVLSFAGIPGILWTYLRHTTTRFKITHRRVEYERGVLNKDVDSLELWRVLDVRFKQNILDRILGNASVVLIGTDQSDPELKLYGLPNARNLFEQLRDAVQAARHTSRPMEVVGQDGAMEHFGMGDVNG